jgi:hypothetical protein
MLILLLVFSCQLLNAQEGYITLKKKGKAVRHFWKDAPFTFQLRDKQWVSGVITGITTDSFYFRQEIIRYSLIGTDTLRISGFSFSPGDIYALPTRKQSVVYVNDQVKITSGREKFIWIRNGFVFKAGGAGYLFLNLINHLIDNDSPFTKNNLPDLGIGAAVYLLGAILHRTYKPYIYIGKKYQLEMVVLQPGYYK